jgi:type VI secretion system protein ImpC
VFLGDYEFTAHPNDFDLLAGLAKTAAACSCPFVTGAGAGFFGLEDFGGLPGPGDIERLLAGPEHARWRSLRDAEESRHLALVLPRVLARLPHGKASRPAGGIDFEEVAEGRATWEKLRRRLPWMSAVYLLGERIADSAAKSGWPGRICGLEGGGLVEGIPHAVTLDESGGPEARSAEVAIDEMQSQALTQGGFLPLLHCKNTDMAVFFTSSTVHKPRRFRDEEATASEAIGSRLWCVLTAGRFLQALTLMAQEAVFAGRDSPGDIRPALEERLNGWLSGYVRPEEAGAAGGDPLPLREGRVEVRAAGAGPGLEVRVFLKPAAPYAGGDPPKPLRFTLRFD